MTPSSHIEDAFQINICKELAIVTQSHNLFPSLFRCPRYQNQISHNSEFTPQSLKV